MNRLERVCTLCCKYFKTPLDDFNTKYNHELSHMQKLSSCLSRLSLVIGMNPDLKYRICKKCSSTVHIIFTFNAECLENVRKWSTLYNNFDSEWINSEQVLDNDDNYYVQLSDFDDDTEDCETESQSVSTTESRKVIKTEPEELHYNHDYFTPFSESESQSSFVTENIDIKPDIDEESSCDSTLNGEPGRDVIMVYDDEDGVTIKGRREQKGPEEETSSITETKNPRTCQVCNVTFEKKYLLFEHMKIHDNNTTFLCHVCGKTFKLIVNLRRHMIVHSDEKIYDCELCGKEYKKRYSLTLHYRQHELPKDRKDFECEVCNKKFRHKNNLKTHQKCHLGLTFCCDFCNKKYNNINSFRKHKKKCYTILKDQKSLNL